MDVFNFFMKNPEFMIEILLFLFQNIETKLKQTNKHQHLFRSKVKAI